MTYDPDGWSKWEPHPREAPAWLKKVDLDSQHKLIPFEKKQKYPLDFLGLLVAGGLMLYGACTFIQELLK